MLRAVLLPAAIICMPFLALGSPTAQEPAGLYALLRQVAAFTAADLAAMDRGQPVARVLETERAEVAIAGAVRIHAPRERILDRYRDVSHLAKSEMVLQVGRFSDAPKAEDLRPLVFEDYDLDALRECEPGDCAVRLSASTMTRFQQVVNWRAADWRTQAAALWRQVLAEYAAAYRANGDQALAEYHNKEEPLRLQEQFGILFRQSGFVTPFAPDLVRHLQEYPQFALPGTESFLYWSKDNFGLRPVVSISHVAIHRPPDGTKAQAAFVGTKQIYATHYFDAALGITLALDDGAGGSYMVVVNRCRTRSLTSRFRGFVRNIVQSRSRDGVEKVLRSTKEALERRAPSA
jgi:hypothetical protein